MINMISYTTWPTPILSIICNSPLLKISYWLVSIIYKFKICQGHLVGGLGLIYFNLRRMRNNNLLFMNIYDAYQIIIAENRQKAYSRENL